MPLPRLVLILSENWTLTSPRDLPALVDVARRAEGAGFDAVMLSEHIALGTGADAEGQPENPRDYALPGNQDPATPWPDSLVLLSAIAAVTTRLRLVAGAIIPPLRHPVLLAKQLATLDLLSGGRLVVQPTVSWHRAEYDALGVDFSSRGALLDEHLEAWRLLWDRTPASFEGQHYRFEDVYSVPKPFRAEGPWLWFGGSSLHAPLVRRIVTYGHGFNPLGTPAPGTLEQLGAAMGDVGRDLSELELIGGTRGRFPDASSIADLDEALATIPAQVEQGFTTICIKPSQFTDDPVRDRAAPSPDRRAQRLVGRPMSGGSRARSLLHRIPDPLRRFLEEAPEIHPFTLRFFDADLEDDFQRAYFRDMLPYIRIAHVMGIASWIILGILAAIELRDDQTADLVIRYGIGVPLALLALVLSYASWYPRHWRLVVSAALVVSAFVWSFHRVYVEEVRSSWGWAGMLLLLAFAFILSRLPFTYATAIGAFAIVCFDVITYAFVDLRDPFHFLLYANFFLVSFAIVGMAAAYGLERSTRLLYLRERELDRARERADALLENTLPRAIVERLKDRHESPQSTHLADGFDEVTVLFADLVRFTERAEMIEPEPLVATLDDVFTRFDELADQVGMEKIKTVGDAYMAVAGAPEPREDHAEAALEMAVGIVEVLKGERWPNGEPMEVRVGIATGPVVAGVIGRRKFAYDLWGDTVNLASRLESNGTPGRILVSAATAAALGSRYRFSDALVLALKGKGPDDRVLPGGTGDREGRRATERDGRLRAAVS